MKEKIILLNLLKYKNEKGEGTRIEFFLIKSDSYSNNEKFKGANTQSQFYDSEVFNKIPIEIIGKPVECVLKPVANSRNPLSSFCKIESIIYNGNSIRLL